MINNLFYRMKSKFMAWFSDIRLYPLGLVLYGKTSYQIKGTDIRFILNMIKPGDVLLRRYNHFIGSMLVPGHFSHVGLYVGDNSVYHMTFTGIVKEDILTFTRCDSMCLLRPYRGDVNQAISIANEYLVKEIPYDFNFESTLDRMYCTELIDKAYDSPVGRYNYGEVIMPDEFMECGFFEVIWKKT